MRWYSAPLFQDVSDGRLYADMRGTFSTQMRPHLEATDKEKNAETPDGLPEKKGMNTELESSLCQLLKKLAVCLTLRPSELQWRVSPSACTRSALSGLREQAAYRADPLGQ
jgi:hypothetical protein